MCGIVGYVGDRPCKELLLAGLERLEYRGYDSAGICLINGSVEITRRVGRVQALRDAVGPTAAGRRWAWPTPAGRPTAVSPKETHTRSRPATARE